MKQGESKLDYSENVTPTGDTEETYFYGAPRLRGYLGQMIIMFVISAVIACIPYFLVLINKRELAKWWVWLAAAGLGVAVFLGWVLYKLCQKYRITNYRIDIETGVLNKKFDTLELWHVEDIQLNQSFIQRILQLGDIRIRSNDDSDPYLELECLPTPRVLFNTLKQRIIAVKRQRGVLKVDGELGHADPHLGG